MLTGSFHSPYGYRLIALIPKEGDLGMLGGYYATTRWASLLRWSFQRLPFCCRVGSGPRSDSV